MLLGKFMRTKRLRSGHAAWVMWLQVGAQWAVEQETIQIGSVTADFAQPTSEQQVRMYSTLRLYASST